VSGSRTEQPTPRRLREARRRGDVGASAELSAAAALVGGLVTLAAVAPRAVTVLAGLLRTALEGAVRPAEPSTMMGPALAAVLRLTLALCAGAGLAALVAGGLQAGFVLAPEAARPRIERLDPAKGLRRLFSSGQLAQAALGVAKAVVLLAVTALWLRDAAPGLAGLPRLGAAALWRFLPLLGGLALRLPLAFLLLGTIDLALARRRHQRALRMTRDEVRRETREDEGDPSHRAERRRRHRSLLEAGPVSRATVLVVNPTHVAVALRHDRRADEAPRVLAKGTGLAAARLRSLARRAGVPIIRDVPLARALHRLAEVGDEIPEELYDAAAAVLAHLYGVEEVTP
jgi:type III secretion protein U